jgi:alkaline phosphatase
MSFTQEEFENVVKPVIEFINKNGHPHSTIIISTTHAEMCEGTHAVYTEEYLKD